MHGEEARRITGRHLLLEGPGAAIELRFAPGEDPELAVARTTARVRQMAGRLGVSLGPLVVRTHRLGASLAVRLDDDALLTGAEILEWAAGAEGLRDAVTARLAAVRDQEASPSLRALLRAAPPRPVFHDEDGVTLGLGRHAHTWPLDALPPADALPDASPIPVAYVTGTNGKTTTTRLLARMVAKAGLVPGYTSSDGVVIGDDQATRGDWTGPGAARRVLRDPRVDLAVLETARGGMLRRGLVLDGVDAAVVTNVSADHLGEWGVDTVEDMAHVKLLVAEAVRPGGTLVVHGRCGPLAGPLAALRARRPDLVIRTFADGADGAGLDAWADDHLWITTEAGTERLIGLYEVPVTRQGTARHNVENALAAALAAVALGLPLTAVREALRTFGTTVHDSAGRLNVFRLPAGGCVVVDFAHNPDGVRRLASMVRAWPYARRRVVLGQAGDRSDEDLDALADAALEAHPERVYVKELAGHLRGRALGEVPHRLCRRLHAGGLPDEELVRLPDEVSAARQALDELPSDGLLLLLAHERLEPVLALLAERGAVPA